MKTYTFKTISLALCRRVIGDRYEDIRNTSTRDLKRAREIAKQFVDSCPENEYRRSYIFVEKVIASIKSKTLIQRDKNKVGKTLGKTEKH